MGDYIGEYYRAIAGDSRSLDYSSCRSFISLRGFRGLRGFRALGLWGFGGFKGLGLGALRILRVGP